MDLKTDARDPIDGGGADGNKGADTGTRLRPSVAARWEAQAATGGGTTAPAAHTATEIVSTVAGDTMNHVLRITGCTLTALGCVQGVAAETAGTVLFAQPGTQIVGESGVARAAVKGDVLQNWGALADTIGVHLTSGTARRQPDWNAARVRTQNHPCTSRLWQQGANFTLQSGTATVNLNGADLESAVVSPDAKPTTGAGAGAAGAAPGSYQRLLAGTDNVANGNQVAALAPRQVNFLGGGNAAPVTLTTPAQNVFAGNRFSSRPQTAAGASPNNRGALLSPMTPHLNTFKIPVTVPVVKPCTRFIGSTCIR